MMAPLYPGHHPGNRLPPKNPPESRAERRQRVRRDVQVRHQRAYYVGRINRQLRDLGVWRAMESRHRCQALAFLNAGDPVPGWLTRALREISADIRRVSSDLAQLREVAWLSLDDGFPEEERAA
jgi:hypothetical protein